MRKEAYYFSHDANAQDDPKCMQLMDDLGVEGYGIFWLLIEKLRSEKEFILPYTVVSSFAKRWGTTKELVEKVINDYGLFVKESNEFYSERLKQSMDQKSQKAKESISYRWGKNDSNTKPYGRNTDVIRNDTIKVKEKKVKESIKANTDFSAKKDKQPKLLTEKERAEAEWKFEMESQGKNIGIQP